MLVFYVCVFLCAASCVINDDDNIVGWCDRVTVQCAVAQDTSNARLWGNPSSSRSVPVFTL